MAFFKASEWASGWQCLRQVHKLEVFLVLAVDDPIFITLSHTPHFAFPGAILTKYSHTGALVPPAAIFNIRNKKSLFINSI